MREIFEFVRAWFLEHVKGLLEIQEKVEEEEKMVDPKALNRLFGGACSLCNVGRFIEEKHEDLSFSEARKYAGPKDEESCPLRQMRDSLMDKILEIPKKMERKKDLYV